MHRLALLFCFCLLAITTASAQNATTSYAPASPDASSNIVGHTLALEARLIEKGKTIERGMVWRIFGEREDSGGKLPLIATAQGGSAAFNLPAGSYLVHAAFGRAGATKRVTLADGGVEESFVLEAGGLELNAETDGANIAQRDLRFSIYEREQNEEGKRKLIALNVPANRVVRLNAGTYHVLSRFGTINATVRADLEVKAGKVTKAVLQHRGAAVSMRLVSQAGGDPVANTAWAVFTEDGEKVFESTSVAPQLVLAEGIYEATVRNGTRDFRQTFEVTPGQNIRVEIKLN